MDYLNMNLKSNTNDLIFDDLLVFKYINPDSNDKLSDISGLDLQDLIFLINHSSLKLREKLGLEQYITFGLEIEFEKAQKNIIKSEIYDYFNDNSWSMVNDNTLNYGAEIVSPILKDNEQEKSDMDRGPAGGFPGGYADYSGNRLGPHRYRFCKKHQAGT